jgi:hypothetical protein
VAPLSYSLITPREHQKGPSPFAKPDHAYKYGPRCADPGPGGVGAVGAIRVKHAGLEKDGEAVPSSIREDPHPSRAFGHLALLVAIGLGAALAGGLIGVGHTSPR